MLADVPEIRERPNGQLPNRDPAPPVFSRRSQSRNFLAAGLWSQNIFYRPDLQPQRSCSPEPAWVPSTKFSLQLTTNRRSLTATASLAYEVTSRHHDSLPSRQTKIFTAIAILFRRDSSVALTSTPKGCVYAPHVYAGPGGRAHDGAAEQPGLCAFPDSRQLQFPIIGPCDQCACQAGRQPRTLVSPVCEPFAISTHEAS